jgi:uncharacterized protein YjbJ (UPF0337 family)
MGELTDKAKGLANEGAGKTKQAVADATNDPSLDQEGKAQSAKGNLQQTAGSIKGALGNDV